MQLTIYHSNISNNSSKHPCRYFFVSCTSNLIMLLYFSGGSPMLQLWQKWCILRAGHLWWCNHDHRSEHKDMSRDRDLLHAGHCYYGDQRRGVTEDELSCRYWLGIKRRWIVCRGTVWRQRRRVSLSARHPILSHWCNTRYRTLLLLWQPVSL